MNGPRSFFVICAIATVLIMGLSGEAATQASLRLNLDLSDGSHLIGTPKISSIRIRTSYAKMDLPLQQILQVVIDADLETASIEMANGDKLKGVLTLRSIEVVTLFGKVSIERELIRRITVRVNAEGGLPLTVRDGLVLYYSFDKAEGQGVTDQSGKGSTGEIRGATWTPQGKTGGALQFDGVDDFLTAGNSPVLRLSRDFTLMSWIKPEPSSDGFGIITKSHGYPEQQRRGTEFTLGHDGSLSAYFWDETSQYFSGAVLNLAIPRQEWTFVVLQHDSSLPSHQMRAFINGVAYPMNFGYETVSSIPVVRNVAEPLRIGCMRPGYHHFKGLMDDVMIFDRVLTASQVQQIYNLQK